MIAAHRLTRRFGPRLAVEDLSLTIARGEILALLGPNGAGKTTTMRMLAGLIGATSGTVTIDGEPLSPASPGALRARVGFLTESPGLWDRLTVRENLLVHARLQSLPRPERAVDAVLDELGLAERREARAAELSKGLRQKAALARTLLHGPPALLLDEPTSGLDPQVARDVRELLVRRRASGCAILVSTHNLAEVERLADRVAVLRTRLLALERPEALTARHAPAHLQIRVAASAAAWVPIAARWDPAAVADGDMLTVSLAAIERDTPALVRALVEGGADVLAVIPATADLEDAYLQVVAAAEGPR